MNYLGKKEEEKSEFERITRRLFILGSLELVDILIIPLIFLSLRRLNLSYILFNYRNYSNGGIRISNKNSHVEIIRRNSSDLIQSWNPDAP